MKRQPLVKLLLVITLLLALLPVGTLAGPPRQAEVHPMVWETLQAKGEAEILVVLRTEADLSGAAALSTKEAKGRYVYESLKSVAEASQEDLRAMLDAQGTDYHAFFLVNAIKVRADETLVRSLAARSDVDRIVPNPWVKGIPDATFTEASAGGKGALNAPSAIEQNLIRVNADDVWALGYTGQGVVVAGNDTGIQWDHPALIDQYREQQPGYERHDFNWHDAINNQQVPYDGHSHGTHTLGTIVGDDGGNNQIGMAPGARWIGCKNMSDSGIGSPASYIECFEFLLAPYAWNEPGSADPALAPHVINNSWGCPPSEGCDPDTLEASVETLRQAGIVVVVSAGNSGSTCGSVNTPPAIYQQSFTVAAFDHDDDQIAGFSSRGPVTYGGDTYTKPDIAAPGVSVRSCIPTDNYGNKSGTSMAAPHVAGAVALLLSAAPGYSGQVDAIESLLSSTTEPKFDGQCGDPAPPNNVWGWGILDALAVVEAVQSSSLQGTVTDADSGDPIADAVVIAMPGVGLEATTNPTGYYTMSLPAGVYSVTADATSYLSQTISNVVVISVEVTTQDFALELLQPLQASFESNSPIYLGQSLILTNTSSGADTWLWEFGDEQISTAWEPTHTYTTTGQFLVTLTVSNSLTSLTATELVTVRALTTTSSLQGTVTDASSSDPITAAAVTALPGIGLEATTDLSGYYTMSLPAGVYSVTADAAGYLPQTISNVVVISGEIMTQDFALTPALRFYLPLVIKDS